VFFSVSSQIFSVFSLHAFKLLKQVQVDPYFCLTNFSIIRCQQQKKPQAPEEDDYADLVETVNYPLPFEARANKFNKLGDIVRPDSLGG